MRKKPQSITMAREDSTGPGNADYRNTDPISNDALIRPSSLPTANFEGRRLDLKSCC